MVWLILGIAYGLGGTWMFRETYRDARGKEERKPLHAQRPVRKDALECAFGALFWPVVLALMASAMFILWLGFRQDRP